MTRTAMPRVSVGGKVESLVCCVRLPQGRRECVVFHAPGKGEVTARNVEMKDHLDHLQYDN